MSEPATPPPRGEEDQAVAFLLDLVRALHLAYLPAHRLESLARGAARGLGLRMELFTLQSFVATETTSGNQRRVDIERLPFNPHWNLRRTSGLLLLTRAVTAGQLTLAEARAELDRILHQPRAWPEWLVFVAYGVYGAAVAARVGGRWWEMAAAGVIGVLAGLIHFGTLRSMRIDLQKSFLAAFVGTLVALGLAEVLPPFDLVRALFGGVTLLIPAMVVTLGADELVSESVEAGMSRLTYGLLRFLLVGVGLIAASRLWTLFLPPPAHLQASPLPEPVVLALVALGGVALTVCMGGQQRELPWIVGAALLAFGTQELTKLLVGGRGSPLLASFVLGVAGALYARLPGRTATTVIMPGLLQLAPGFLGTQAVVALLRPGAPASGENFFDVLLVAAQIVMGLVFASALAQPRPQALKEEART
ncbi:threonine/serine exporter family protein [Pyxidicoccus fallax]|uniref:Threonine/serine exporter family protein n=1 Tax=Pyxidicoccus fallax TaxID=394095 RepID=A0A848LG00_9BACT|nr:threonine/serine exporter family protein [Pyxidicoccus fallax]NMO14628.1 threonine/serine exporter family protein [Pyxidicoccus fallax]NPC77392.1 threonine/serine exporter family protein [Pyxidicoccus fallax]